MVVGDGGNEIGIEEGFVSIGNGFGVTVLIFFFN